jgi:hypothetical protein
MTLVLPFVGGSGPSLFGNASSAAAVQQTGLPIFASAPIATTAVEQGVPVSLAYANESVRDAGLAARAEHLKSDSEHLAQKPVPKPVVVTSPADRASGTAARRAAIVSAGGSCPGPVGGGTNGAPSAVSAGGVAGTTSADLASFAVTYNAIRVANCLQPVPMSHFRYDSCMEARLFWMAEDPSEDPLSAWGHMGSVRSDGLPSTGCDGNLAGGYGNTGATVAQKWWNSTAHRNSLYKPTYTGSTAGVCIYFAMTHGGVPNESYAFTRAAAKWGGC